MHPHELHQQDKDAYHERHQEQSEEVPNQVDVYFLYYSQPFKLSDTKFSGNRSAALWKI